MKIWNASEEQIRQALNAVGLKPYGEWRSEPYGADNAIYRDGRALRLRLAVDISRRLPDGTLPYQRVSTFRGERQRRVAAVCWHGHRDFLRALFELAPDARVKSALADYHGSDEFERIYADTYGQGNAYNLSYGQACTCEADKREEWE